MRLRFFLILLMLVTWGVLQAIPQEDEESVEPTPSQQGLSFQLSEGGPPDSQQVEVPAARTRPLSDAEAEAVLRRLPPFKVPGQTTDFAMREKSQPPPRTGQTIQQPFPPPQAPDVPSVAPKQLEVLRKSPDGAVPIAPQLSVTFNQPMVAVTSHDDLAGERPVKLTPQPPGNWRWVGTQTLLFDPRGGSTVQARFPMSTEYRAEVPAGTKSASGQTLAAAVTWSFSTPTVAMESSSPSSGSPQPLDPLMWVVLNQDIDPAAVFATLKLSPSVPLRLATPEEIKKSPVKSIPSNRLVAFRATTDLTPATSYTVTMGPGTPSQEGPLKTSSAQSYSFRTYDKFAVISSRCGYNDNCPPLTPFMIDFNNPIDARKFRNSMVSVTPELPRMKIDVSGQSMVIRGESKGRTTYTVKLSSELPDSFGQRLEKEQTLTFKVGSADPQLIQVGGQLAVVDPYGPPTYSVYVINHQKLKVRINAVTPAEWHSFCERLASETVKTPFTAPGQVVFNGTVETNARPDELTEVRLDLKKALQDGHGMAVVEVQPVNQPKEDYRRQRVVTWVQVTELGLDAASDDQTMQGWVTSLKDGTPVSGARLALLGGDGKTVASGETGGDGLGRLALGSTAPVLVASRGGDVAMLPQNAYYWGYNNGWHSVSRTDSLSWFVVDDRKMYRPDEEVHLKGFLRRYGAGPKGDISALQGEVTSLTYRLQDSQGNELLKGTAPVSREGGFDLTLKLPKTPNLGQAYLHLEAPATGMSGTSYNHGFEIQEFRRPEFQVSASAEPDTSIVGESATVTVQAKYYAGGGLAGAPVQWYVSSSASSYSPPGRSEYSFGTWIPWWGWGWEGRYYPTRNGGDSKSFQGRTDAEGVHHLKIAFTAVDPPTPTVVRAQASVTDVNRQQWSATTSVLVHPSDLYLGLKSPRSFLEKGQPLEVEILACDRQGKALSGRPIEVKVYRQDYEIVEGQYRATQTDVQKQSVVSSGNSPSKLSFQTPAGGTYKVEVRGADEKGRWNQSDLTIWVAGGKQPPERKVEQQQVTLIPNQKEFRAGETAEILVQAPFYPAEGVMTLRRSGLLKTERFKMEGPSTVLKVPIEEGMVPNVFVQVDLVGAAERPPSKRPAYAVGTLNLSVPPFQRTLKVEVAPAVSALDPGVQTSLRVQVTGPDGKPAANTEVAVFVVDEAVLSLTGYQFPDPLKVFYGGRPAGVEDHHNREYVVLAELDQLQQAVQEQERDALAQSVPRPAAAPGSGGVMKTASLRGRSESAEESGFAADMDDEKKSNDNRPISVRTDFNPSALFAPVVMTDASGAATVPFKLPDNLTRYRIVALAARGRDFGKGESALTARLPLMVRPSPPRFLNFGDRFELPVVLQNQTDRPLEVQVVARSSNATLTGAHGYALSVPANNRVEVRFPSAAEKAGTAAFQVGAVAGQSSDAAEFNLPVWTPATSEAFATYGQIDQGAISQPVKAPSEVFPQYGGLDVTTSSTAVQELTDAVLYLVRYPFDCSEQVSSRVMSIAALKDVLSAFKAAQLPSPAELKAGVDQDIARLKLLQNYDGGFGFWNTSSETWPYLSVHVAHALVRAREKGFTVPEDMLERSKSYLRDIESHIPGWYGPDARRLIIAYALYVRHRMKDSDSAKARWLIKDAGGVEKLPIEAVGWILYVLSKDPGSAKEVGDIRHFLANRVTEEAGTAHFVTGFTEENGWMVLVSNRCADGILLEALIEDQPKNDIIPKLVRGLLAHRKAGHWLNTQENCFVLLALDRYFNTYEKATPDFVARIWLGDQFAGQQQFKGRQVDRQNVRVPMSWLAGKGTQNLVISKSGAGRLYYRLGMEYAPKSLKLDPSDHGFAVERVYEAVDAPGDVTREANGTWVIKSGARVRVRLTMAAPSRRYHVALVDPMPAGLEAMNPSLAVTGDVPADPKARGSYWYWLGTWYEHQNLRDERVEAFASLLWSGVYDYSYVARATTPGEFVVPPAKAEEMYNPETFGRSSSDRVIVR